MVNLFNGIKPTNISFEQFLELIDNESSNNICWKTEKLPSGKILFLFSNEWNLKNNIECQNFMTKYFNNIIIDNEFNILMFGGSKIFDSNRDNFDFDTIKQVYQIDDIAKLGKFYEAYEGTNINVFYEEETNKWFYTTKKKFRMHESFFASKLSHGSMFNEIILCSELENKLNKNYTYNFSLIHKANTHLIKNNIENKLILTSVRDRLNSHDKVNLYDNENIVISDLLSLPNIKLPNEISISDFYEWNNELDIKSQGIILHYENNIFRIYTNAYSQKLKSNPKFHTDYEKLFWSFQTNELNTITNEVTYNITICTINYIAIMLFRTVLYFTKYKKDFTKEEKINYAKYNFITKNTEQYTQLQYHNALKRNIYKLQRLPFAVKGIDNVDFNQVKHHIKYHCSPQDIYSMYLTFIKNPNIETMVTYKCSPSQRTNINDFINIKLNQSETI